MISQTRLVVVGGGMAGVGLLRPSAEEGWHGFGEIRLATVIESEPAYDPANERPRA